jgi:hypothetical protein
MADKTVDDYVASLEGWQAEILTRVREIILQAAPEAHESIKWAQPVYESSGPFAYIKAFKKAVNFGFWRGVELEDPKDILEGSGEKMRHVKLASLEDVDEALFADLVKQAVVLNQRKGDPTKGGA